MTDQLQIAGHAPIQLTASRYVLGREAGCDVVLQTQNGTVSRQHAALERNTANQWTIVDLNSTNGVYVNERRVTGSRILANGDNIRIGDNQLTLQASVPAPSSTVMESFPPVSPQPVPQPAAPPQQPVHHAPPQTYCQKCGTANAMGVAFCSNCGNGFNAPPVYAGGGAPGGQNQNVNVNVINKNSNGGWWAALLLLFFGTPLGCIAIPAALIMLALLFTTGVVFLPIVVAVIAAVIVWKHPSVDPAQRTNIVAGILVGGFVIQALLFMGMHG